MALLISITLKFILKKVRGGVKEMRYECPYCGSMRKPKIVNYYPPVMVQCIDCKKEGIEKKFIKEDEIYFNPIPPIQ